MLQNPADSNWQNLHIISLKAIITLGRFEKLPEDGKACQSAEIYQQEVLAKDENGYQGLALLMDTVEVTGVKGVFVNKEAIENFFSRLEK